MKPQFFKMQQTIFFYFIISLSVSFGQNITKQISLKEALSLALVNHPSLKINQKAIEASKQQIAIAKLNKLPNAKADAKIEYIGDALIVEPNLSESEKIAMPHFGNTFSVSASQLLYKGNIVNNTIQSYQLQEQLTELDLVKNQQEIKFLVASYYLDLIQYDNQIEVYDKNIELAKQRLKNINSFYKQGIITRDDVIRSELQISNLNLEKQKLQTQKEILQNDLSLAIGFKDNEKLEATSIGLDFDEALKSLDDYEDLAKEHAPNLLTAEKQIELAEKKLQITKAELSPTVAAFAGLNVTRPITMVMPVIDKYMNAWSTGLSISYDLSALYKSKKNEQLDEINIDKAKVAKQYEELNLEKNLKNAFLSKELAEQQWEILKANEQLANENYRIVEKKYLNQFALFVDMMNASNEKLSAELKSANARLNILYNHYQILKLAGSL